MNYSVYLNSRNNKSYLCACDEDEIDLLLNKIIESLESVYGKDNVEIEETSITKHIENNFPEIKKLYEVKMYNLSHVYNAYLEFKHLKLEELNKQTIIKIFK